MFRVRYYLCVPLRSATTSCCCVLHSLEHSCSFFRSLTHILFNSQFSDSVRLCDFLELLGFVAVRSSFLSNFFDNIFITGQVVGEHSLCNLRGFSWMQPMLSLWCVLLLSCCSLLLFSSVLVRGCMVV